MLDIHIHAIIKTLTDKIISCHYDLLLHMGSVPDNVPSTSQVLLRFPLTCVYPVAQVYATLLLKAMLVSSGIALLIELAEQATTENKYYSTLN